MITERKIDSSGWRCIALAVAVLVALAFSCGHKKRTYESKWEDGSPKTRYGYYLDEKGKKVYHGTSVIWHRNGKKYRETTYRDGQKNGRMREWADNGTLTIRCTFKNGRQEGEYRAWHPDGSDYIFRTYVNGRKHGEEKVLYPNGNVQVVRHYDNGAQEGSCTWYYGNGTVQKKLEYRKDALDGTSRHYFPDGSPKAEYTFVRGSAVGPFSVWDSTGALVEKGAFRGGVKYPEPVGAE